MKASRFLISMAVCAAALQPSSPARGDENPGETVDQRAAHWMAIGNKAFREGQFEQAKHAYREAFALKQGYDIAGNLGATELAQHEYREAATHLAFTLQMFPLTGDPSARAQMEKAFNLARAEVGSVAVTTEPERAPFFIDGTVSESKEVFVDPGRHLLEARLDGYEPASREVLVGKGEHAEVRLVLRPIHTIPVETPKPPPPPRRSLMPGLVLSGVAVVGLGVGVGLVAHASSEQGTAVRQSDAIVADHKSCVVGASNRDGTRCDTLLDTASSYAREHNAGVGVLVASALAAAGAGTYFLWPHKRPSSPLAVTPVVGPGGYGLSIQASF